MRPFNSSHDGQEERHQVEFIQTIFVNFLLMVFVCGGNLLTIVAILRDNNLKTIPNMYILSLSVSDFLVGLVLPSQRLLLQIPSVRHLFAFNKYMCLVYISLERVPLLLSLCCIVLVSFDRYIYIVKPFLYARITMRHVKMSVIFCWIVSLLYGSIIFFHNDWQDDVGCIYIHVLSKGYYLYSGMALFGSASFLSVLCYVSIIRTALRHRREIAASPIEEATSRKLQLKSNFRLVKMFAIVFGMYFICWSPTIINNYFEYNEYDSKYILNYISTPLVILNSGLNCFVYAWMDKDFRTAFKKILCKCSSGN